MTRRCQLIGHGVVEHSVSGRGIPGLPLMSGSRVGVVVDVIHSHVGLLALLRHLYGHGHSRIMSPMLQDNAKIGCVFLPRAL